jgi:cytochrome P450
VFRIETAVGGVAMAESFDEIPELPTQRSPQCPLNPPTGMYVLRDVAPITKVRIWTGDDAWLVTRYADARSLLGSDSLSNDTRRAGFPFAHPARKAASKGSRPLLSSMDDPEHAAVRRFLAPEFMVRRIDALRPTIQGVVDRLIDDMLAGPTPAELVQAFALPIPSIIIAALLGVPADDMEFFQTTSELALSTVPGAGRARHLINDYVAKLIELKREEPADDLLSLLARLWANGDLEHDDAVNLGHLILVGGHETTANMIAVGVLALLQHPEQVAVLRDATEKVFVENAIEELLRYGHIAHNGVRRVAVEDIEVSGQTIREGDGLIIAGNICDRDPEAFEGDPDELDITRPARHHVAFGYGIHQCLGQPLARAELQIAIPTLLRRIPDLALAVPFDQVEFKDGNYIFGVRALPVTW